jgi:hypothetical protein
VAGKVAAAFWKHPAFWAWFHSIQSRPLSHAAVPRARTKAREFMEQYALTQMLALAAVALAPAKEKKRDLMPEDVSRTF